jgi:hypothetical protein
MFSINQSFGKHCSCHLQVECVVGRVLETLYRAAVGDESDLMVLIGGAEERTAAAPHLPYACYMACSSHPLRFDRRKYSM